MDVRIGSDGVVEVNGPCVMRGYWRNPELTAEVLRDGWLRTGDVGVLGEDGNLTLVGRSGDMYIRGGYNIHPGEVERTIAGHPGVKQVAVVGRSAPVIGEIGVACVVPADGAAHRPCPSFANTSPANWRTTRRPTNCSSSTSCP